MKKKVRVSLGVNRGVKHILQLVGWPLAIFAAVHGLCLRFGTPPSLADVAGVSAFAAAVAWFWGLWQVREWAAQAAFFLMIAAVAGLAFHRQAGVFVTIGIIAVVFIIQVFTVLIFLVGSHGDRAADFLAFAWLGQGVTAVWMLCSDSPALSAGVAGVAAVTSLAMRWWPSKPHRYSFPSTEKIIAEAHQKYIADGDIILSMLSPDVRAALEAGPSRAAREKLLDRFDHAPETTLAQCRAAVAFCEASSSLYGVLDCLGSRTEKLTGRLLTGGDVIRDAKKGPETVPSAYFAARIADEAFLAPEAAMKVWRTIVVAILTKQVTLDRRHIRVEASPDHQEARLRITWDDPDDPPDESPPSPPSP